MTRYLVTGANGYIAMHVVKELLKQGSYVRGTIKSLSDREKVDAVTKLGPIELVEADLQDPEAWKSAVKGIDTVFHIASPLPATHTANEDSIVKPAVEGLLIEFAHRQ